MTAEDRVALVTGSGRGIGRAIAERLCGDEFAVVLVDVEESRVEQARMDLQADGYTVAGITADITRPEEVDRMVREAERVLGPIDVLVNNVGVFLPTPSRAEDTEFEAWRRIMDVNVNGTFLVCQRVGRRMIGRNVGGSIVNIASIYGMRALDWRLYGSGRTPPRYDDASYHVSKAAVIQLTRSLATSWAEFGIRVNSVSPGPIDSESSRESIDRSVVRKISGRAPMGRLGRMSEIAESVSFLASDRASYITGANLVVDGGWTCW